MLKLIRITGILLVLILINQEIFAQSTRTSRPPPKLTKDQAKMMSKEAKSYYDEQLYKTAIPMYIRLVDYDSLNVDYNYNLGICYLMTNVDRKEAYKYLVVAADQKDAPKDVMYRMGEALLLAGLYDEAIDALERYKTQAGTKVQAGFDPDLRIGWCNNAKQLVRNPVDVTFTNPGKKVNSKFPDYAPMTMAVDTIVYFTSNRQGNMGGMVDGFGEFISDVYYSVLYDTLWYRAKNLGYNVNFEGYDVGTGINTNGDQMLIYKEGGGFSGDIFTATQRVKTWQKAELLDKKFDSKTVMTGACLSPDGRTLYFAAELKDSYGGTDIYMSLLDSTRQWSDPVNLGPEVNTPYNEDQPFIYHDGITLFFASEGHNSMGGYDIFVTSSPDRVAKWNKPVNIGYPLNTPDDNLYFTLCADGRTGWVTALMPDGIGDLDNWQFKTKEKLVSGNHILVWGDILGYTGLPAKDALCKVTKKSTGELMGVFEVTGRIAEFFIVLEPGTYEIMARSPRLGNTSEEFTVSGNEKDGVLRQTFNLKKRGR